MTAIELLKIVAPYLIAFLVIAYMLGFYIFYIYHCHKISRRIADVSDDGCGPSLLWIASRRSWGKFKHVIDRDPELKTYVDRFSNRFTAFVVLTYLLLFAGFIAAYVVKVHHWPWGY